MTDVNSADGGSCVDYTASFAAMVTLCTPIAWAMKVPWPQFVVQKAVTPSSSWQSIEVECVLLLLCVRFSVYRPEFRIFSHHLADSNPRFIRSIALRKFAVDNFTQQFSFGWRRSMASTL